MFSKPITSSSMCTCRFKCGWRLIRPAGRQLQRKPSQCTYTYVRTHVLVRTKKPLRNRQHLYVDFPSSCKPIERLNYTSSFRFSFKQLWYRHAGRHCCWITTFLKYPLNCEAIMNMSLHFTANSNILCCACTVDHFDDAEINTNLLTLL